MRLDYAAFLGQYFPGEKIQKISVNAVHRCPTRDGTKGYGGCTYCNNKSFSPAYSVGHKSVSRQLEAGISFFRRKYPKMRYLAYFQSYTNTYGDTGGLMALYKEALAYPGIVGIVIGTRPDCMPQTLLEELSILSRQHFLLIEYGIESTLDKTLALVHRGHDYATAVNTVHRTASSGILCGAHLILGLPGETRKDLLSHADRLSELPINTLKLHQLQIVRGSEMAREYEAAPRSFRLFSEEEYIELCADFTQRLREDIIIERYVSQTPEELLLAPRWGIKNYQFAERIRRKLTERM